MSKKVTDLIHAWQEGDKKAYDALLQHNIYNELLHVAARQLRKERKSHTIDKVALVGEVYNNLLNAPPEEKAESRKLFFGLASTAMRNYLVNYARDRNRQKRGGHLKKITLEGDLAKLELANGTGISNEGRHPFNRRRFETIEIPT